MRALIGIGPSGAMPARRAVGAYDPARELRAVHGRGAGRGQAAVARGERPIAAVAVLDEAMVARGHDRVRETDDPTAHAVIVALREAARRVGKARLRDVTMFARWSPARCASARFSTADVEALVYAIPNRDRWRRGHDRSSSPSTRPCRAGVKVVSGIRRDEVEELLRRRLSDDLRRCAATGS